MNTLLIIILLFLISILAWALLGERTSVSEDEKGGEPPEKIFRRRASDREIESEFPDDSVGIKRRKSDREAFTEDQDIEKRFKIPFLADEIIPETSRFRLYRRTLVNSEIYAKKGDYTTAISLYQGVRSRINDATTQQKIDANIQYLTRYREREESELSSSVAETDGYRLTVDRSKPSTINIGVIDPEKGLNPDRIANRVIKQLKEDMGLFREGLDELKKRGAGEESPELAQMNSDIDELRERINTLNEEKERTQNELDSIKNEREREYLDKILSDMNAISDLKNELNQLNKKLEDLTKDRQSEPTVRIPESTVIQAKYDSPIPITIDPGPILDVLGKLPAAPKKKKEKPEDQGGGMDLEEKLEKITERREEEDEDPDAFELLSEYGKDKDESQMSDDEIFEKILTDSKEETVDKSFEIIGEKRDIEEELDIADSVTERKRVEEENFYRKFLKADKRKRRELPILKVTYDFTRLPDEFSLAREKNILEYSFYKYKNMLEKADEYIKKRKVRDAINYYKVVMSQNIPPEFKSMIRKNINDLTEYLEKYMTGE